MDTRRFTQVVTPFIPSIVRVVELLRRARVLERTGHAALAAFARTTAMRQLRTLVAA